MTGSCLIRNINKALVAKSEHKTHNTNEAMDCCVSKKIKIKKGNKLRLNFKCASIEIYNQSEEAAEVQLLLVIAT